MRWLLDALHAKVNRKINILEAIRFVISRWEDVPPQVIRNCWMKCDIVDGAMASTINQMGEYRNSVNKSVEDDLTSLMESLSCTRTVHEYIDVDDDESIEGNNDTIERDTSSSLDAEEGGNASDNDVKPTDALASCIQVSSFLSLQHDSDDIALKLASVIAYIRKQCALRKSQVRIDSFFNAE